MAEADPGLEKEGRKWFKKLEDGDTEARRIWQECVDVSMAEFNRIYEMLKVKFDEAYGESFYVDKMAAVIDEAKTMGIAIKSEEAWVIEIEGVDIPLMLVKSDGSSTYFTRDMATVKYRLENPNLKANLYVYEVGAEQSLHFKQVFATAEKMCWGKKEDFVHIAHGLVLGVDGKKMSTRKGTTESMEGLLKKMIEKAGLINNKSAKEVGVGAVIFNDLKHSPQTSYKFDWEKALSLEGDSGPYVQYACVRARSVLELSMSTPEVRRRRNTTSGESVLNRPCNDEVAVLRKLYRFGEVVERAAREFSPNLVCEYLLELARSFNSFYGGNQVLGSENEEFRLALTAAVAQVLENGLRLLHIEVPAKM